MRKNKLVTFIVASILGIFGLSLIPSTTHAVAVNVCEQSGVSDEVLKANGCPGKGDSVELSDVIIGIVNGIIGILGLVAVIFIVVGGVNYMTSTGDPTKTKKAKDTILYAVIGLIIAVLSFAIVNFVISNVIKGEGSSSGGSSSEESDENGNTSGGGPTIQGGGAN